MGGLYVGFFFSGISVVPGIDDAYFASILWPGIEAAAEILDPPPDLAATGFSLDVADDLFEGGPIGAESRNETALLSLDNTNLASCDRSADNLAVTPSGLGTWLPR
jgi:hypothetical protein